VNKYFLFLFRGCEDDEELDVVLTEDGQVQMLKKISVLAVDNPPK